MALSMAMVWNRKWWIGGTVLQCAALILQMTHAWTTSLVLSLIGLGALSVGLLDFYDRSELKTNKYELIPKDRRPEAGKN
jgi:hypothetical protein